MCTACLTPDPQVLLPCEHPAEGAGRTALLPVPSEPNGAEVNKKDEHGKTPLHYAADQKHSALATVTYKHFALVVSVQAMRKGKVLS